MKLGNAAPRVAAADAQAAAKELAAAEKVLQQAEEELRQARSSRCAVPGCRDLDRQECRAGCDRMCPPLYDQGALCMCAISVLLLLPHHCKHYA
jgi:hypothetical protein